VIYLRKLLVQRPARKQDLPLQFIQTTQGPALLFLLSLQEPGSGQHMGRRIFRPILEKRVDFVQGKRVHFPEGPAGGGADVRIDEVPIR
jgi:hypothetical protein